MKKIRYFIWTCCALVLLSGPVLAADTDPTDLPWKKAYLDLGLFYSVSNTTFRLGEDNIGTGISLDVEDFLGLDSTTSAFRIGGGWRFTKNMRHKLEFGWFAIHRDASGTITEDINIPPEHGGGTILAGEVVDSEFNFDLIKLKYEYSFILDDRLDLNLGLGLFVMPFEFGVQQTAGGNGMAEDITAPLPVGSLGFDFAITPKWFVRQQLELFYLKYGDFTGAITGSSVALEYIYPGSMSVLVSGLTQCV